MRLCPRASGSAGLAEGDPGAWIGISEDEDADDEEDEEWQEQEAEEDDDDENWDVVDSDGGSEVDALPCRVQASIATLGDTGNPAIAPSRRRSVRAAAAPAIL